MMEAEATTKTEASFGERSSERTPTATATEPGLGLSVWVRRSCRSRRCGRAATSSPCLNPVGAAGGPRSPPCSRPTGRASPPAASRTSCKGWLRRHLQEPGLAQSAFSEARWPNGVACGRCGSLNIAARPTRRLRSYRCRDCRFDFAVKSGTVMQDSKLPLRTWAAGHVPVGDAPQGRVVPPDGPRPRRHAEDGMAPVASYPQGVGLRSGAVRRAGRGRGRRDVCRRRRAEQARHQASPPGRRLRRQGHRRRSSRPCDRTGVRAGRGPRGQRHAHRLHPTARRCGHHGLHGRQPTATAGCPFPTVL